MDSLTINRMILDISHRKMIEYGWNKYVWLPVAQQESITACFVRDLRRALNMPIHFRFDHIAFQKEWGILEMDGQQFYASIDKHGSVYISYTIQ